MESKVGFYIGSIGYFAKDKEELKEFIYRNFRRNVPSWESAVNYNFMRRKYFETPWTIEDADEEIYQRNYRGVGGKHACDYQLDITAMLYWWRKYGKHKTPEIRNLFNMEG